MKAKNLFYTVLLSSLIAGCFEKDKNIDPSNTSNALNSSNAFQSSKDLKEVKDETKDLQNLNTQTNKNESIKNSETKQKLLNELSQLNSNLLSFLNSKPFKNTTEKLFIDGIDPNLEYYTHIVKGVKSSDELISLLGKEHNFSFEENEKSNSLNLFLPKDFYLLLIDLHKEVPLDKEKQISFLKEIYSDKTDTELEDMVIKNKYYEHDLYLPNTKIKWLDFLLSKHILLSYKNEESDLLEFFENNNNLLNSLKSFGIKDRNIFFKILEVVNKIEDFSQDDVDILRETIKSINLIKICFDLEDFKNDHEDTTSRAYSDHVDFSGLNFKHKVMNFSLNKYVYLGGAHGNNYIEPINIDLINKKIISPNEVLNMNVKTINEIQNLVYEMQSNFENATKNSNNMQTKTESLKLFEEQKRIFENKLIDPVFSNEYRKYLSLRELLQEKLKNYLKKIDGEYYDETQVPKIYDISFDFYVHNDGLTFIYQPYHLLPFVYGHIFLKIPFEELQQHNLLIDGFKN